MRRALRDITEQIEAMVPLRSGDVVLDIGANDGTLLASYTVQGIHRVGCEPANNLVDLLRENADYVMHDFWDYERYMELASQWGLGKAKVITAIGMADRLAVMVVAVVAAVIFMMVFAGAVSRFVERHPTLKVLALSFLLLIGVGLVADGLHFHIPKGYIYFAMAFSIFVEMLNLRVRGWARPVALRHAFAEQQRFAPPSGE